MAELVWMYMVGADLLCRRDQGLLDVDRGDTMALGLLSSGQTMSRAATTSSESGSGIFSSSLLALRDVVYSGFLHAPFARAEEKFFYISHVEDSGGIMSIRWTLG